MELPEHLTISLAEDKNDTPLTLSETALNRIAANRNYLEKIMDNGKTYYGINTGFGSLCNVRIDKCRPGATAGKPGMLACLWYG